MKIIITSIIFSIIIDSFFLWQLALAMWKNIDLPLRKKKKIFKKIKKEFYSKVDEELKNKMIIYLPTKMVFGGLMFLIHL